MQRKKAVIACATSSRQAYLLSYPEMQLPALLSHGHQGACRCRMQVCVSSMQKVVGVLQP